MPTLRGRCCVDVQPDFCFWGAPGLTPNNSIGDIEAAVVAYVRLPPVNSLFHADPGLSALDPAMVPVSSLKVPFPPSR